MATNYISPRFGRTTFFCFSPSNSISILIVNIIILFYASNVYSAQSPSMISPVSDSTLTSATVTFQWNQGTGVSKYWLGVGTSTTSVNTPPYGDIYGSTTGKNTTQQVTGIPINGNPLHVRLWYKIDTTWFFKDYMYQTKVQSTPSLLNPTPGSSLMSSSVTFQWSAGSGVNMYYLGIGTSQASIKNSPWGDIYAQYTNTGTTATVSGIPLDGSTVYVRLWYKINTAWFFKDYTYLSSGKNNSPVLNPIGNKYINVEQPLHFSVSANDPDGDTLNYTASNLPLGVSFNESTCAFSWVPAFNQAGTYSNITFHVSDGKDTASESITITVANINRVPVLDPIADITVNEGDTVTLNPTATDPDGDPLAFTCSGRE